MDSFSSLTRTRNSGCVAANCTHRSEQGFRVFRFPSDPNRRKKWLNNIRRKEWTPTNSLCLCEVIEESNSFTIDIHYIILISLQVHFEESQFDNKRVDGLKKLKPIVVPTLFDVPNPPPKIDPAPRNSLYKIVKKANTTMAIHELEKLNQDGTFVNVSLNYHQQNVYQKKRGPHVAAITVTTLTPRIQRWKKHLKLWTMHSTTATISLAQ
ncbi:uncharacterized protein LOC117181276 [Belonocnema kinseyi]|uniref:uncharacterized protein LOC117181276 n=1 Tax=Belonocnema kinseyi TaxID=2817044 RepID=UPI00143DA36E|nr:uncharacterized protein LOC117181276 [Belonocnema kinseyi]